MKHELVKKYEKQLLRRNYSPRTISSYSWCVEKYAKDTNTNLYQATVKSLDEYLTKREWTSVSQQNTFINAMKNFFEMCLDKKANTLSKIQRPRKEHKLPKVLDVELVKNRIEKIQNLKHKAILSLGFSVGLRVSEVCKLKISDIDSHRMEIRIEQSKGHKDRIVPLSPTILNLLRDYFKTYRPKIYLFEGQFGGAYSPSSCQKIFKNHISKNHSFHSLRHSCFTTLLERGTDMTFIQKIAGHNNIKTTQIYAKVTSNMLSKIPLPI